MDEQNTLKEVLAAVDEFLIYRTEGKLQELLQVRNKLRRERQQTEENVFERVRNKYRKDYNA